jgi:hypothetical protein
VPRSNAGRIDQAAIGGDASVVTTQVGATTTFTSPVINSNGALYLAVIFDTTAIGTASLTASIVGVDPASGKNWTVLTGTAVVTNLTTVYRVGPSLTPINNLTVNDMVPVQFKIIVTAGSAAPASYTVGYHLAP